MRVLVCGGRDYKDEFRVYETLAEIMPSSVIHGNASGADGFADSWADANHTPVIAFSADWGTYGRAAGPIRNKQMLEEGKPDLVIAFPGGKGTANMVQQAREANIEVREIT